MKNDRKDYHDRPEWSYSQMKLILDSGIDYAVAAKKKMLPEPVSKAIDLGQTVHLLVLGGEESYVISPYDNYRTKVAREWREQQQGAGHYILSKLEFDMASEIAENIKKHPRSNGLLIGDGVQHEVELYATTENGTVSIRGKADALKISKDKSTCTIVDLKTTSQFDSFKYRAQRLHYDLQAANYTKIAAASLGVDAYSVDYWFCVAETVAPYRVQYFYATPEFVDAGERKLAKCVDEIEKFGDKEPNFLLEDIVELGDFSL